ncbi:hypothetical protein JCGZ_23827 [Jatropha curcas]|uniref:Glycosyltransferase n=1 Tax=Jatropha curcas TaxID=180498 RepID=A0A067LEE6_JATCU|nr:UDP-glycosyltransferase 92A1 [Jatropha curcas]KDP42885.1 hypothetical protein JCGZ_23827 [Jatropha curcas]
MTSKEHIVMLPFMAHGHLIPFLALARQIHQRTGFIITIANTPFNIRYLRSTMIARSDKIRLVELPFSAADHGLPADTENSENLSLDLIGKFFASSPTLENPVRDLLLDIISKEGKPPLCLISDIFFGWANNVANSVGTINISFSTGGAYGTLAYISLWLNLPHRKANSDKFHVPGFPERYRFEITQLHRFIRNADGTDLWSNFMQKQISLSLKSFGLLCNTVEEIEVLGLDLLRKYVQIPVWSIGPLLPPSVLNGGVSPLPSQSSISFQRNGKKPEIATESCLEWLDMHNQDSVLYISFGSQNTISPSQMMELAIGLEESKKPFIWVIRPPTGFDRRTAFKPEWLPEGFEERVRDTKRGLLVRNWAPQLEILSHKSTGAFLSHCGWNSVTESLSQGVPIIGWPLAAEQAYNLKMLAEEMGVGVELTRGLESTITWKEVKKVIDLVMDKNGEGDDMRKKAMEIGKLIRAAMKEDGEEKGSSLKAFDALVNNLLSKRDMGSSY